VISLRSHVDNGAMLLLSHDGDGIAEATLAVARCHCRVMMKMTLPSLADDGTVEVTLAMA
jgi:archaellum biogenesis ATPase FlaH